jgi:hypothetical protein
LGDKTTHWTKIAGLIAAEVCIVPEILVELNPMALQLDFLVPGETAISLNVDEIGVPGIFCTNKWAI